MIRQIVWKESREQMAVLLALVGLGAGLMAAAGILGGSLGGPEGLSLRTVNYTGRILLIMLVMTAGVVVGGSLFAGEREAGSFAYLDHLPASRWRVWWRKVLAGGLLTLLASALLLTAAWLAGQLGGSTTPVLVGWAAAVGALAVTGFGWGVFGSTKAESSLSACGIGLLGALATVIVVSIVVSIVFGVAGKWLVDWLGLRQNDEGGLIGLLVLWAVLFVPLPLAAFRYTAPDRSRRLAEQDIRPYLADEEEARRFRPRPPRLPRFGRVRRMTWLLWRQLRVTVLVQVAIAIVLGLLVVPWNGDWPSSLIWPVAGLAIGVLAGVASLGDEQRSGAMRFWAERRLPVGRLWRDKVAYGVLLTLVICLAALLPLILTALIRQRHAGTVFEALFRSGLFVPGFPRATYLLLGPVYGFAFGHMAGMLFQKGLVAGAVGLLLGGTFAAFWVPSLLGGGLNGWMVFVPPVVALLTARWLAWPWATDRLGRRGPLLRLAAGNLAALGCIAAGLAYRAWGDVVEVANAADHLQFRDALPTFDENQPGRDIRRAISKWQELSSELRTAPTADAPANGLGSASWSGRPSRLTVSVMQDVMRDGWPLDQPDLDAWLDQVFANNWDEPIFLAATKPPGVLEDPNEFQSIDQPLRYIEPFRELTPIFLARGLQRQVHGDPSDFVRRLDAWLAACRTAKRQTLPLPTLIAQGCESMVYQALNRWLERLAGRPDLVRQALDVVRRHDTLDKQDPVEIRMAEQVMLQNAADSPGQWMVRQLEADDHPSGLLQPGGRAGGRAETEANLVAFAWAVPWEKERLRRAIALGNDLTHGHERVAVLEGAPGLGEFARYNQMIDRSQSYSLLPVATRRATIASLALRLYRLESNRYPDKLSELVPAILSAIPFDPYDNQPIRYRRLARAETVVLPAHLVARTRPKLPPGATLYYPDYLVVAGLAGGLTGWPFQPGWLVPEAEEAEAQTPGNLPAMVAGGGSAFGQELPLATEWLELMQRDEERSTTLRLAAGRAVLWCVGVDRQDDGGRNMDYLGRNTASDMVFPVPDPPTATPAKSTPKPGTR